MPTTFYRELHQKNFFNTININKTQKKAMGGKSAIKGLNTLNPTKCKCVTVVVLQKSV